MGSEGCCDRRSLPRMSTCGSIDDMTNSSNIFEVPKVPAQELYDLWLAEQRDPSDARFLDAVREMDPADRKAVRRVFERVGVEDNGDWIDVLDPTGHPKVWFRGRSEYVTKVMWTLFHGRKVPAGQSVVRAAGHIHSVHPDHLELLSRSLAISLAMRRVTPEKKLEERRLLMKYRSHVYTQQQIDDATGYVA